MLIVNMFGAPGAGKSTIASGLFYQLKIGGWSVEYVVEVAKAFTYEERYKTLGCHAYMHGKQLRDLERLDGKVDVAITDSPTLLSNIYGKMSGDYPASFFQFVLDRFKSMPSVNFFIERVKPYDSAGRNQTEAESDAIAHEIKRMLNESGVLHHTLPGDESAVQKALTVVRGLFLDGKF